MTWMPKSRLYALSVGKREPQPKGNGSKAAKRLNT